MLFDVIVGNPPYQGVKSTSGTQGKPPTIWPKFIEIADDHLKSDGVLVMVHPAMYRKVGNKLQDIILNNTRQLHMYNNAEAMQTFGASTRYDWYVVDKTYNGSTEVYFEDLSHKTLDLSPGMFLPNGSWDVWNKVINAGPRLKTIKRPDSPDDMGDFDVIQTLTKTKGVVVRQTSKTPKSYGIKKVILSETGCQALYDEDGKYGTTSNCYYVEVESDREGQSLVRFVSSNLCDHLVESCKWGNFRVESCIWNFIAAPWNLGITSESTEEEINQAYGVSADDITFIYGQNRNK